LRKAPPESEPALPPRTITEKQNGTPARNLASDPVGSATVGTDVVLFIRKVASDYLRINRLLQWFAVEAFVAEACIEALVYTFCRWPPRSKKDYGQRNLGRGNRKEHKENNSAGMFS
jgi:hypothetical protein